MNALVIHSAPPSHTDWLILTAAAAFVLIAVTGFTVAFILVLRSTGETIRGAILAQLDEDRRALAAKWLADADDAFAREQELRAEGLRSVAMLTRGRARTLHDCAVDLTGTENV